MSDKLTYAILAMDAYNRGYGAKLPGLSDAPGTKIGLATILSSDGNASAQKIGFYALAYELEGKTVVSFRGTDELNIFNRANDIFNGWVGGAGFISTQAKRAAQYYESVVENSLYQRTSDVLLTGHSLGGGLAGYVAALSNGQAYIYDAMPFAAAAVTSTIQENINKGLKNFVGFLTGLTDSPYTLDPDVSGIESIYVKGEILAPVRFLAKSAGSVLEVVIAERLLNSAGFYVQKIPSAVAAGVMAFDLARNVSESSFNVDSAGLSGTQSHSQALLVLLQFSQDQQYDAWQSVVATLVPKWFDDTVASSFGLNADKMLVSIAYSAIDEGEKPFGDVAIKALFNDSNDLGSLFSSLTTAQHFKWQPVQENLASIVTQYAANLALNGSTDASQADGIIQFDERADLVTIDLDSTHWNIGSKSPSKILNKTELINSLMPGFTVVDALYDVDYVYVDNIDLSSEVYFSDALTLSDSILMIGNGGNDRIYGGQSNDYFTSADGGSDFIDGGGGVNTVIFQGRYQDYQIDYVDNSIKVYELLTGSQGYDIFVNIQHLIFADLTTEFDLTYADSDPDVEESFYTLARTDRPPTGTIVITGAPQLGKELAVSNTLEDIDGLGEIRYQWQLNGISIDGATDARYTVTQNDVNKAISVVATYVDQHGDSEIFWSTPVTVSVAATFATSISTIESVGLSPDGQSLLIKVGGSTSAVNLGSALSFNGDLVTTEDLLRTIESRPTFQSSTDINDYVLAELYTGSLQGIDYQLIETADNPVVIGGATNDFIRVSSTRSIGKAVDGGAGDDVIDGGVGSTFISGGKGNNTIYLDGRAPGVSWSTVTDFKFGLDQVTIWGWREGVSRISTLLTDINTDGAEGYQGLTLHFENLLPDGAGPDQTNLEMNSLTLTGYTLADFGASSLDDLNHQITTGMNSHFVVGQMVDNLGDHGYLFLN